MVYEFNLLLNDVRLFFKKVIASMVFSNHFISPAQLHEKFIQNELPKGQDVFWLNHSHTISKETNKYNNIKQLTYTGDLLVYYLTAPKEKQIVFNESVDTLFYSTTLHERDIETYLIQLCFKLKTKGTIFIGIQCHTNDCSNASMHELIQLIKRYFSNAVIYSSSMDKGFTDLFKQAQIPTVRLTKNEYLPAVASQMQQTTNLIFKAEKLNTPKTFRNSRFFHD
ncbi:MAG: hypothetical protein V4643_12275 [Bacteroidota bacterium]